MEREQIREVLKSILEKEVSEPVTEIGDKVNLVERYGLDSVDVVSLLMQVEQRFRVRIKHDELAALSSVGTLLDLLEDRLGHVVATGG
jgi:acyl carrier protein